MILCLIRHGESTANKENILSGSIIDCELSERGIRQSEEAGLILRNIKFNIVYTSKLKRAMHTAYLIESKIGYKFPEWVKDHRINERCYGILEGFHMNTLRKVFGEEKLKKWIFSLNTSPPKGESNFQVYKRVKEFFSEKIKNERSKNIMIVSHFTVILFLISIIENMNIEDALMSLYIENAKPLLYEL